jgi:hypothetical protein
MKQNERVYLLLVFIFLISMTALMPYVRDGVGKNDFIGYWSSTRLLITGGNPYSAVELKTIQEQVRSENPMELETIMVWNPPWLMLFLIPISLSSFNVAAHSWLLINTLVTGLSLYSCWIFLHRSANEKVFLVLLGAGFIFPATLILFDLGQISSIILISLILFIFLIERRRDTLAGVVLLMTTIKPHLTYLVLLVILIWIIRNRRWKVSISLAVAGILSTLITWIINPTWILDYVDTLNSLPYNNLSTSTLGSFMSDVFGIQIFRYTFLLILPLAYPLAKAAEKIGFLTSFNLALLISIPLSPYGFVFDHVLLLPALTQIFYYLSTTASPKGAQLMVTGGLVAVYLINIWIAGQDEVLSSLFFWVPLALLPLYLLSVKNTDSITSVSSTHIMTFTKK